MEDFEVSLIIFYSTSFFCSNYTYIIVPLLYLFILPFDINYCSIVKWCYSYCKFM